MTGSVTEQAHGLITSLLTDMLDTVEPELSAGLLLAAVPDYFDEDLLSHLQRPLHPRAENLFETIVALLFVERFPNDQIGIASPQKEILRDLFIQLNRDGFIAAQQQAVVYWSRIDPEKAGPHEIAHQKIGHSLMAGVNIEDPTQVNGLSFMIGRFRELADRHEVSSIEKLLLHLNSVRPFLVQLEASWLQSFDDLFTMMLARLAQLRGDTKTSAKILAPIMARRDVMPAHAPYLLHAHGDNQVQNKNYFEAIDLYTEALGRLETEILQRKVTNPDSQEWEILEAERGNLMLALGEAHMGLALAARGEKLSREPRTTLDRWRSWTFALLSLPLLMYLTFYFGFWVWRPDFWVAIGTEDWMIIKLLTKAHAWTQKAKPILTTYGSERENLLADDQQGRIYLELGAWPQAQKQLEILREKGDKVLGAYRQGHIALNLAEATRKLGNTGQAFVLAEEAAASFIKFEDTENAAKAQGLLGMILGEMRNYTPALNAYNHAFRNYEAVENWAAATGLAEYLEERVLLDPVFPDGLKERAFRLSDSLLKREYPIQFMHAGLNRLRLTAMASFALMVLAIPLLVMTLTETTGIVPITDFVPAHLLDLDQPLDVNMSQSLLDTAGIQAVLMSDATVLARAALLTTFIYFLVLIAGGLIFITTTTIDTVERQDPADRILLDHNGISVGDSKTGTRLPWSEIKQLIRANLAFVQRNPLYTSSFGIQTNSATLTIRGRTAWFMPLRRRIEWQAVEAKVSYLDYAIGRSVMIVLYLMGLIMMVGFLLAGWLPGDRLWQQIGRTIYRPADAYTWLFLFLFLPPVWWGIGVRWWHKHLLLPRSFWPWSLLIGGASLT
ncbi:MAG: hypothetical protein AAGD96_03410, partial [Chloroflexota bacterium]